MFITMAICVTTFSKNVFETLDRVDETGAVVVVTRRSSAKGRHRNPSKDRHGPRNYVIMSEENYAGLLETLDIMSNRDEYEHILQSMADPVKMRFSSIEEMEKDLNSTDA
jgi:PHD/YefM family antitoxin component YafN of YafNO toxin-antitoxin module